MEKIIMDSTPHSCDNWVIGGKEEVELMIADLQEVIKRFAAPTTLK